MKEKELKEIRKKLEKYKQGLEGELDRMAKVSEKGEYAPKFPNYGDDEDDNILEIENYSENVKIEERLERLLNQTKKALRNIKDGSYGYCKNCGKQINLERLKAYPIASTCSRCSKN